MFARPRRLIAAIIVGILLLTGTYVTVANAISRVTMTTTSRSFSPNGDGQEDTIQVGFRLDQPGNVTVRITSETLGVIATLALNQSMSAGNQYVTWDGRRDGGLVVPDGDYLVEVTSVDRDNAPSTATLPVVVDTRVPGVVSAPVVGSSVSGLVDFVFVPTAGMDVRGVSFNLPACSLGWTGTPEADGVFARRQVDTSGCAVGAQTLTAYVEWRDQFSASHSFQVGMPVTVVDASAPVVSPVYGDRFVLARQSATEMESSTFYATCVDGSAVSWSWQVLDGSGAVVRTLDDTVGASHGDCSSGRWWHSYRTWDGLDDAGNLVADGSYVVRASATDTGGLTGSTDFTVVVNTQVPGVVSAPVVGSSVSGLVDFVFVPTPGVDVQSVSFNLPGCSVGWTSTPEADGVFAVRQVDTSACAVGEQTLTAYVGWADQFSAGHSFQVSVPVTVVDASAPVVSPQYGDQFVLARRSATEVESSTFYATCVDGSAVSWSWQVLDGSGAVLRTLDDTVGASRGDCSSWWGGWHSYRTWDGLDDAGNLVADGPYVVRASATDTGGLTGSTDFTVMVDTRVPGVVSAPVAGSTVSGLADFVVAPTAGVDVRSVSFNLPGCSVGWTSTPEADGVFARRQVDTSGCAVGAQTLTVYVEWRDQFSGWHSFQVTVPVTVVDASAPVVSPVYGDRSVLARRSATELESSTFYATCVDGSAVSWSWQVLDGSGAVLRTLDDTVGSSRGDCTSSWGGWHSYRTWDGLDDAGNLVADGPYVVRASATDTGGLTGSTDFTVVVDTRVLGNLITPDTGAVLSGRALFEFQPADDRDLDYIHLWMTGMNTTIHNASPDSVWRTSVPMGSVPAGPNTLNWQVQWVDQFGSYRTYYGDHRAVAVDPTSINLEASLDVTSGRSPLATQLTLRTSDPNDRAVLVKVDWGDGSEPHEQEIVAPYDPITLDHTFDRPGTFNVVVTATNGATGFASQTLPVAVEGAPNEAPTVSSEISSGVGVAPFAMAVSVTASDPNDDPLTYRVDFGDGTPAVTGAYVDGLSIPHTYQLPGTYTVRTFISDGRLSAISTKRVQVALPEPLTAQAGDPMAGLVDETFTFDGSGSRPGALISEYRWDFGDGQTASGSRVTHAYAQPGDYTVTLRVRVGDQVVSDTTTVTVSPVPVTPGLRVNVTSGGSPVAGAQALIIKADGTRVGATAGSDGVALIRDVSDGETAVYVWADGFQPRTVTATVIAGIGEVGADLVSGEIAATTLSYEALTPEEIEDRGIDPTAPENQHVFEATINLYFDPVPCEERDTCPPEPEPAGEPVTVTFNYQSVLQVALPNIGGTGCVDCVTLGGYNFYPSVQYVAGQPLIQWLVIPVKASFLKEFFDVKLVVQNLAPGFTFTEGMAGLDLPAGLSLAPTALEQSLTVEVGDIAGGEARIITWTVRGDLEGSYDLAAAYSAMVQPIEQPIISRAQTSTPLKVWGASALEMVVYADKRAHRWAPYAIDVELRFKDGITDAPPIYNVAVELQERRPNATELEAQYFFAPGTDLVRYQAVVSKDQRFRQTWIVYPGLGNDENPEMVLRENFSFVQKTAGNVNLEWRIVARDNDSDIANVAESSVGPVTKSGGSSPDSVTLSWQPTVLKPGNTKRVTGYQIWTRDLLHSTGTWTRMGQPTDALAFEISSEDRHAGRYYAVETLLDDGSRLMWHRIATGPAKYVSLGDSYSSGEGLPAYEEGTDYGDGIVFPPIIDDEPMNLCHRSYGSYARLLAADPELAEQLTPVDFRACSGAITRDLEVANTSGNADEGPQGEAVNKFTEVITLTLGGNDAAFKDAATACITEDCFGLGTRIWEAAQVGFWMKSCAEAAGTKSALSVISCSMRTGSYFNKAVDAFDDQSASGVYVKDGTLERRLVRVYGGLANDAPDARVLIGLYPKLVTEGEPGFCGPTNFSNPSSGFLSLSQSERKRVNQFVDDINAEIWTASKIAQKNARDAGQGTTFEVVEVQPFFDGHELCKGTEMRPPVAFNALPEDLLFSSRPAVDLMATFHPNALGQQLYADAFAKKLGRGGLMTSMSHAELAALTTHERDLGTLEVERHYQQLLASVSDSRVEFALVSPSGTVHRAGDPGVLSGTNVSGAWLQIQDATPGTWSVRVLTVEDATAPVVKFRAQALADVVEVPRAMAYARPGDPAVPGSFVFDASASTGTSTDAIATYRWSFPDGSSTDQMAAAYRFSANELPVAVVEITTTDGKTSSMPVEVTTLQAAVPTAPEALTPTRDADTVSLVWQAPQTNGGSPLSGYVVRYRAQGTDTWAEAEVAADTLTWSADSLAETESYDFQVLAVNAVGRSEPAEASLAGSGESATRLSGTVTSATGPINAAVVQILAVDSDQILTEAITDELGQWHADLPAETASVRLAVTAPGFSPWFSGDKPSLDEAEPISLTPGTPVVIDSILSAPTVPDIIKPVVTGSMSPAANVAGWHRTDVTVTWSVSDDRDTITDPPPTTIGTEGKDQVVTSPEVCDSAGNCASSEVTVSIDRTPPTITGAIVRTEAGQDVARFACTDTLSGVATCPDDVLLTFGMTDVIAEATDRAGNTTSTTVAVTAPAFADAAPPAGQVDQAYTFTFSASGVPGPVVRVVSGDVPAGLTLTPTGELSGTPTNAGDHTFTVEAVNAIGAVTREVSIHIDPVPDIIKPVVTGSVSPAANVAGWHRTDVTVTWSVSDDRDTITAPPPTTIGTEGKDQVVTSPEVCDSADNCATGEVTVSIDRTPPTITGAIVRTEAGQDVARFACTDTLSGVATCPDDVVLAADMTEVRRTAIDTAGNLAIGTVTLAAPVVTTTGLAAARIGDPYSVQLEAAGVPAPAFTLVTGTLPAGITLSESGLLAGTPTASGSFDIAVQARNVLGMSVPASFTLEVSAPPTFLATTPPPGQVEQTYSYRFEASGHPSPAYSIASGALPAGLVLAEDGTLSGTPTVAGDFVIEVIAGNSAGRVSSGPITVRIVAAPILDTTPPSVIGQVQGVNEAGWASGPITVTWLATDPEPSSGGIVQPPPTVIATEGRDQVITSEPVCDAAGNCASGTITVNIDLTAPTIEPTIEDDPSGPPGAKLVRFVCADALSGVASCPADVSITADLTDPITGTVIDRAGHRAEATIHAVAPAFTSGAPIAEVMVDDDYDYTFTATGVPLPTFTVASGTLPDGLTLASTGELTGRAIRPGTWTFAIAATSETGQAMTERFTISVLAQPPRVLEVTTQSMPGAVVGRPYDEPLAAIGGTEPYTWRATGRLPKGMTVDRLTGRLQGVPDKPGEYTFNVTVTDGAAPAASASQRVTIIVAAASLNVEPAKLKDAKVGRRYVETFRVKNGSRPYVFALDEGPGVNGLTLTADGRLSGIPSQRGEFIFTVRVTDAFGATGWRQYVLVVN